MAARRQFTPSWLMSFSSQQSSYTDLPVPFKGKKKKQKNKTPAALKAWRFSLAICLMVSLAIGLEVALVFSNKQRGFPTRNLSPGRVQFYSSFIPTLSITVLAWYWKSLDRAYRRMQPYVNMSRGPTTAKESVLLDLEHMNFMKLFQLSYRTRQYLILISTTLAFLGIFYHPLASSLFLVRNVSKLFPAETHVQSLATLGLNPQGQDLSSFVAAAGFSEAASYYNLGDPPFVRGPWAVARFQYPSDVSTNSTVRVNTTAIESNLNCTSLPVNILPNSPLPQNTTLNVTVTPGCSRTVIINPASAISQYGVQAITNCSTKGEEDISPEFAPVLFWFYTIGSGTGQILARAVFCDVSLRAAVVQTTVDGKTGLLTTLNVVGDIAFNSNNITSGPFNGNAFNGVAFDSQNPEAPFNLSNTFIAARALAIQTQIPGAIFRAATNALSNPAGLTENGILNLTQNIYTRYLSTVALGNYFVPASEKLIADVTLWPTRLFMNARTVHILSILILLVSLSESILYYIYRHQSRNVRLGTRPGFIAHCMSILPQTDVNPITPKDNKRALKQKLDNMRFMLDDDGYVVGLSSQEVKTRQSRGASWISQQKSMQKFHPEPFDRNSTLYSPGPDSARSWGDMKSPGSDYKSAPLSPLPKGALAGLSSPSAKTRQLSSASTVTLVPGGGDPSGQDILYQPKKNHESDSSRSSSEEEGWAWRRSNRSLSTLDEEESQKSLPLTAPPGLSRTISRNPSSPK